MPTVLFGGVFNSPRTGAAGAIPVSGHPADNLVNLSDRRRGDNQRQELQQMKRQSVYPYVNTEVPGATIHTLRSQRDWGVRDLSEKTGLDHSTISRIENNGGYTKDSLERIAAAFGCSTQDLFLPPEVAALALLPQSQRTAIAEQIAALVKVQESRN